MSDFTPVPLFTDNDVFDTERANAIISNINYLNEVSVKMSYQAYGETQTENIKIACGVVELGREEGGHYNRTRNISFGNFFTPGTNPVVNVSIATTRNSRTWSTISGRSGNSLSPDSTGFRVRGRIYDTGGALVSDCHWIAIGY